MECAFCGSGGKEHKEHVFPTWLRKFLALDKPRIVLLRSDGLKRQYSSSRDLGVKTGGICRACNNGWMSALENQVEPLLSPFILGAWPTLNIEQRATLTRWALKTAAAIDLMNGEHFFTQFDRQRLRALERLDDMVIVAWQARLLAAYAASSVDYRIYYSSKDGAAMPGYVSTLTLGHNVLQTLVLRPHRPNFRIPLNDNSRFDGAVAQLWPSIGNHDAPKHTLTEKGHGELIDRFKAIGQEADGRVARL